MKRGLTSGVLVGAAMALVLSFCAHARAAGALGTVTPEIVKGLGTIPPLAVVVAAPLVTDQTTPKGDELVARMAAIVAGRIGGAARAHPQSAGLAVARAVAGKAGALVFVQVEIAKGELRVTADLYPVMSNGWDRVRIPAPAPRAHVFTAAPLDAEIRAFLPAIVLEQASVHKSRHDEGEVLAAACGDLDGDGGMEIALVSRARVTVGRIRAGKFTPLKSAAWSALSPRGPATMREPLASAVFTSRRGLYVGLSDRGGVLLDANLVPTPPPLLGIPVQLAAGNACAHPNAESGAFEGDITACSGKVREVPVLASPPVKRYDMFAQADIVDKDGTVRSFWANREPSGKLRLRFGETNATIDGVGAQVAIGDLDADGIPEVVTSADAGDDFVTVQSWAPGTPRARMHFPAPAGVRALAVCPPEEKGAPALVAVVGGEIWVVR